MAKFSAVALPESLSVNFKLKVSGSLRPQTLMITVAVMVRSVRSPVVLESVYSPPHPSPEDLSNWPRPPPAASAGRAGALYCALSFKLECDLNF